MNLDLSAKSPASSLASALPVLRHRLHVAPFRSFDAQYDKVFTNGGNFSMVAQLAASTCSHNLGDKSHALGESAITACVATPFRWWRQGLFGALAAVRLPHGGLFGVQAVPAWLSVAFFLATAYMARPSGDWTRRTPRSS